MTDALKMLAQAEAFLASLPALSRPVVEKYFRNAPDVLQKPDDSPVTIADKTVESVLRMAIAERFPAHAIVGEEEGGQADQPYCWVIDPIDGTRAFVIGKPLFGTLVGLVYNGQPICGMIDMPALKECYLTQDGQAYLITPTDKTLLKTRQTSSLETAQIATTSPEAFTKKGWEVFQSLSAQCVSSHYGGDCYNYALLAAGHLDLVVEHQLAPHDVMGLIPVIQAAGGSVTNWQGEPVTLDGDGSLLAAANPVLHQKALSQIKRIYRK